MSEIESDSLGSAWCAGTAHRVPKQRASPGGMTGGSYLHRTNTRREHSGTRSSNSSIWQWTSIRCQSYASCLTPASAVSWELENHGQSFQSPLPPLARQLLCPQRKNASLKALSRESETHLRILTNASLLGNMHHFALKLYSHITLLPQHPIPTRELPLSLVLPPFFASRRNDRNSNNRYM